MKKFIIGLIRFYQRFISPLSPPRCRFYPTCSQYALEAVQIHGAAKGSWLGFKRICRCQPWGGSGIDFVPPKPIKWQTLNYHFFSQPYKSDSWELNGFTRPPFRNIRSYHQ